MRQPFVLKCFLLFGLMAALSCSTATPDGASPSPARRPVSVVVDGAWIGNAISYGPYRDGQRPGEVVPHRVHVVEDLQLLVDRGWRLLRVYGADEARIVLEAIRAEDLPLRVMIGAWLVAETRTDESGAPAGKDWEGRRANEYQVDGAIALANAYPKETFAVSVGNEARVFWSDHIVRQPVLIEYVRRVRSAVSAPVTVADDFNYWNKAESREVADEIDFIVTHIHAHWAGARLPDAMAWTEKIYDEVQAAHPDHLIVIGEAGWATRVHTEGEQAKLIKGRAGESEQKVYYDAFTRWARDESIIAFYFEAFDENWKGGPHPDEVEKHWGIFNADRSPKAAMSSSAGEGR